MIRIGLMLMVLCLIGGGLGVAGGFGTIEIVVLLLVFVTGVALIAQGVTKHFSTRSPRAADAPS